MPLEEPLAVTASFAFALGLYLFLLVTWWGQWEKGLGLGV